MKLDYSPTHFTSKTFSGTNTKMGHSWWLLMMMVTAVKDWPNVQKKQVKLRKFYSCCEKLLGATNKNDLIPWREISFLLMFPNVHPAKPWMFVTIIINSRQLWLEYKHLWFVCKTSLKSLHKVDNVSNNVIIIIMVIH